jgi:hypothetical protein
MEYKSVANTSLIVLHDNHNPILEIAQRYVAKGWAVTPVQFRTKRPILKNWQGGIPAGSLAHHFGSDPVNIGIVLGDPSQGLVDIDIDDPIALQFVEKFLPDTTCVFGRRSMPKSHWIYRVPSTGKREAFVISGKTIAELRGNGLLTVFRVPSIPQVSRSNSSRGLMVNPGWLIGKI